MTRDNDPKTTGRLGGDAARPALDATSSRGLLEREPPLTSMLPNTHYFEIDSVLAGARYVVWVATPRG